MKVALKMVSLLVTNYDPPYKTLFFVCYSTVAAIVATEAGLLGSSDSYAANQSYYAFADDYDSYLKNNKEHPWCGTGRMDHADVGYLAPDGDGGVRFDTERQYVLLKPER